VNSRKLLYECCNSSEVMMVEGDISYSEKLGKAIMAHPPKKDSDLTFEEWIAILCKSRKGAKLDFKKLKGEKESKIISSYIKTLKKWDPKIPLIINADIQQGPNWEKELHIPINPKKFVSVFNDYFNNHNNNAIVSLGWVTKYVENSSNMVYTKEMIDNMLKIAKTTKGNVTFSIGTDFIKNSIGQVNRLIENNPSYTITLWGGKFFSKELKLWIRNNTDPHRTFYDLPIYRWDY